MLHHEVPKLFYNFVGPGPFCGATDCPYFTLRVRVPKGFKNIGLQFLASGLSKSARLFMKVPLFMKNTMLFMKSVTFYEKHSAFHIKFCEQKTAELNTDLSF